MSRLFAFLALLNLPLAVLALYGAKDDVQILTSKNFNSAVLSSSVR
jgi:hypothetical protein